MDQCKDYCKFVFLVNNTVVGVEAESKTNAINIFREEFPKLFNMDWEIKRMNCEVNIDRDFVRY